MTFRRSYLVLRTLGLLVLMLFATASHAAAIQILQPADAPPIEKLAAREVQRVLYLRTRELAPIHPQADPAVRESILISVAGADVADPALLQALESLRPAEYLLRTIPDPAGGRRLLIVGGDGVGALYGAYRFAELLGVRHHLHGDIIPDEPIAPALPDVNELGRPLFETRGLNPFHDFPEGPDWWDRDDWMAHLHQLAKLRMNFVGLHCYPLGKAEPTVWIGVREDMNEQGEVSFSYPSTWAHTRRDGMWGYDAMDTSDYTGGADQLFPTDIYGPAVMDGILPMPEDPEQANALFNRAGAMFGEAFTLARALCIKTAVGTETPLRIPDPVAQRLRAQGRDPRDPAVVREVYQGMFERIMRTYPIDYYWLWTPEFWSLRGNSMEQYEATLSDLTAALGALDALGRPFTLATCGWVLGPQHDRAALDEFLPPEVPMSCINRRVGHAPVEPGFAAVSDRPKWAIPWLENDPNMIAPQPWVGRMRYDAADALRLGCTGLLGIHWRTKVLAPNIAALAAAAWDQSWVPAGFEWPEVKITPDAPVFAAGRGRTARFSAPVAGADEQTIYQTVRYDFDRIALDVPNGVYTVTLKFVEPHHTRAGRRVFGIRLQDQPAVDSLDIFARVGINKALDLSFPDVTVAEDRLEIEFVRQVEYPCIAGIVIEGEAAAANQIAGGHYLRRINMGGSTHQNWEPDPLNQGQTPTGGDNERHEEMDRAMPVEDFYLDFARASFGQDVGREVGLILASVDGTKMHAPSRWIGPGAIIANTEPWEEVRRHYDFVRQLERLRPRIQGAGNLERFDYWLRTFQGMEAMAESGCRRGQLDQLLVELEKGQDPAHRPELAAQALDVRLQLARAWERMMWHLISATDTPGELGTLANIEHHNRKRLDFLSVHDEKLAAFLGHELPAEAQPARAYRGPARLIVPTARELALAGEALQVRVILLTPEGVQQPVSGRLHWRELGSEQFQSAPLSHLGRSVYRASLPPAPESGLEYYLEATIGQEQLCWPATAPRLNQTLVVMPPAP